MARPESPPPQWARRARRALRVCASLVLLARAVVAQDCDEEPTATELKLRPWFCRTVEGVEDNLPKCLGQGHRINWTDPALCRGRWQWFQLSTVHTHDVPYYEVEQPAEGGPAETVRKTQPMSLRHSVAFTLNTAHCPHSDCESAGGPTRDYYTTVDVLIIDGDPLHEWDEVEPFPEGSWSSYYRGSRAGTEYRYFTGRKRVVGTLGYNYNGTQSCAPQTKEKVNIGVYCSWNPSNNDLKEKPCLFDLTVHLIPEILYDGYDARLPMAPAGVQGNDDSTPAYDLEFGLASGSQTQSDPAAHHYSVQAGDFDVIEVNITRAGNNLTSPEATTSCKLTAVAGKTVCNALYSAGHGLQGHLVHARDGACPNRTHSFHNVSIDEYTTTVSTGAFCTTAADAGTYRFAVLAADDFGPFPRDASQHGMVGPDLYPLPESDNRAAYKSQPGYGDYQLNVRHVTYAAGALSSGEVRPTCLSWGQWRYFTIQTSGAADAAALLELGASVSAVYLRAGSTPTASAHDVAAPAHTPRVSATPCDVGTPTTWHVALTMGAQPAAAAAGIEPAEFSFTTTLESAVALLDEPIVPPRTEYNASTALTTAVPGRGYVCCGATRNYRVSNVPEAAALQLTVNVTSGTVRAIYLKWNTCPQPDDVDSMTGECRGFCELAWLATRGGFSGLLYNQSHGSVLIPSGAGLSADKRRYGAWYLAVQGLPDIAATFTLSATLVTPEALGATGCTRYTMACPDDPARISWSTGPPSAPRPPPTSKSEDDSTRDQLLARALPTVFAAVGIMLGVVAFQHVRRRRFHKRIRMQRV